MLPGHCSACNAPAEQYAGSRRWWHVGEICDWRSVTIYQPVEISPLEGGGYGMAPRKVDLPARFIPLHNGGQQ
jgi:hypothetical protein